MELLWVSEGSVGEIWDELNLCEWNVWEELKLVKSVDVVKGKGEGEWMIYWLDEMEVGSMLKEGIDHGNDRKESGL